MTIGETGSLFSPSKPEQSEQFEQREQYEQSEQYEQCEQSAQPEQHEQYEQSEQYEQPEQREQYEQSEQYEQLTQFLQFTRLSRAFCAASRDPKYETAQRLPFASSSHSSVISFSLVVLGAGGETG